MKVKENEVCETRVKYERRNESVDGWMKKNVSGQ